VTSNHVHLIVKDNDYREMIPKSIQLIAGRTGQEYNLQKKRKGAYWEDRYHATAVETDRHLLQCLVYVDLNMVRVGICRIFLRYSAISPASSILRHVFKASRASVLLTDLINCLAPGIAEGAMLR